VENGGVVASPYRIPAFGRDCGYVLITDTVQIPSSCFLPLEFQLMGMSEARSGETTWIIVKLTNPSSEAATRPTTSGLNPSVFSLLKLVPSPTEAIAMMRYENYLMSTEPTDEH
jgi:hypothetical protein